MEKKLDLTSLGIAYTPRYVAASDTPSVLALFNSNLSYFRDCPPLPSERTVRRLMEDLPEGLSGENKHVVGFWDEAALIAVLDLLEGYPDAGTAWVGLLMIDRSRQRHGLGTRIVEALCAYLERNGITSVQLGYIDNNVQAENFWKKNGFEPTGRKALQAKHTVIIAEKKLR